MSTSLTEKTDVSYCDTLLQRAVVDAEFRTELLCRPEEFGLTKEDIKNLPTAVENQDLTFVEYVIDDSISAKCTSTCVSGYTIRCDGTTFGGGGGCRSTCVSGYTIRCDGTTY
jgi:Family of unknown function (DUF5973)